MSARVLVIFAVIFETTFAQIGAPCTTPNFEDVTCLPISKCKVIFDALRTRNSSAIQFAVRSQCGHDSEPLVCCGSLAYPTLPYGIFDIFTKAPEIENRAIILSNFNTKDLPDRSVCGLHKLEDRIIGGEVTEFGEFPWMAALEYKSKQTGRNLGIRCGGSLINNRYVLTAAHCIINKNFKLTKVWLGEWNTASDPDCRTLEGRSKCADPILKLNIKDKIPHPFYKKKSGINDIGLIRMEVDVRYSNYIRPICLPLVDLPIPKVGTNLTIVGWGANSNGTSSNVKLKTTVPLISNNNCINKLKSGIIRANQLCLGGEPGKGACRGDSGGLLMRTYDDKVTPEAQWYQEGVVVYGVGCGGLGQPAIYTRVSRYISWIKSYIKED